MSISFEQLKEKQRALRDDFPQEMGLRVHRAISWIGRAEREEDDPDARFVFLWIAFNAAYSDETEDGYRPISERAQFVGLLARLVEVDEDGQLHQALWSRFQGPVKRLIANRFVFRPFWLNENGVAGNEDWLRKFRASAERFVRLMADRDTARVLTLIFDRLYVLRCQLMHGSTTWNSSVNREQVRDGAELLSALLPIMLDVMLDHPEIDWGTPSFPVIGKSTRPERRAN